MFFFGTWTLIYRVSFLLHTVVYCPCLFACSPSPPPPPPPLPCSCPSFFLILYFLWGGSPLARPSTLGGGLCGCGCSLEQPIFLSSRVSLHLYIHLRTVCACTLELPLVRVGFACHSFLLSQSSSGAPLPLTPSGCLCPSTTPLPLPVPLLVRLLPHLLLSVLPPSRVSCSTRAFSSVCPVCTGASLHRISTRV